MKFLIFTVLGFLIISSSPQVFAAELTMYTNQQIYTTQHPLLVYGTGPENAPLVLRLFAPDGSIAEFEQITTNPDGSFIIGYWTGQIPQQNILLVLTPLRH